MEDKERQGENGNKREAKRKGYQFFFIHFVKYKRDGECEGKGGRVRNCEGEKEKRKGYLYILFISDHLSPHCILLLL